MSDKVEVLLHSLMTTVKDIHVSLGKLSNETQSLKFEMHDRFNELKNTIESHHLENIKSDELIFRTLSEYKTTITDEIVTHENQLKVLNNHIFHLEADVEMLKNR